MNGMDRERGGTHCSGRPTTAYNEQIVRSFLQKLLQTDSEEQRWEEHCSLNIDR